MNQPKGPKQAALFKAVKVLIVEDNSVDREILKTLLEHMGFEFIQEARNGSDAIFKIENAGAGKDSFDLIITDWKMPERDGLSLIQYLRRERLIRNTLVVMLTSVADLEKVKLVLKEGIDDFVVKPIQYDLLSKKLEHLLRRRAVSKDKAV